jgi:hypothetical protein
MDGLALSGAYLRFAFQNINSISRFLLLTSLFNRPRYVITMFVVRPAMTS